MSKKMTAVDFIIETLAKNGVLHSSDIDKAKAMEKEQMKDCYWYGDYDGRNGSDRNFEQYYNETFKPKQR